MSPLKDSMLMVNPSLKLLLLRLVVFLVEMTGCSMILYTKENIEANGGLLAVLNIFGPPYEGEVNDLRIPDAHPSYWNNLHRIVYGGAHCNCVVTIHQETNGQGKSIDYETTTAVRNSDQTKVDIDWCWANKAKSVTIKCRS